MKPLDISVVKKEARDLVASLSDKDQIWALFEEVDSLLKIYQETKLQEVLSSELVGREDKISYLRNLDHSDSRSLNQLIEKLIEGDNYLFLYPILQEIKSLISQSNQVYSVQLRTAYPFTEEQKKRLRSTVEKRFSIRIDKVIEVQDPSLMAGFILYVNNHIIDTSLTYQLQELRKKL